MQIKRIFSTLVNDHLNAFDEEVSAALWLVAMNLC